MAGLKELEKLMRGTGEKPTAYKALFAGTEKRQLIRVREEAEDYEEALKNIKEKVGTGSVPATTEAIVKSIDKLYKLGYRTQISEMTAVDRAVKVGNLMIKFKLEPYTLDTFFGALKTIKKLSLQNRDRIRRGMIWQNLSYLLKIKGGLFIKKEPKHITMEIEEMRIEASKFVKEQRHALKYINSLKEKAKEDKNAMKKFETSLRIFSLAVENEMKIFSEIIANIVLLFDALRKQVAVYEGEKFPENEPLIVKKLTDVGNKLREMAEIVSYRMMGNPRG